MQVVLLYRRNSESEKLAREFVGNYERQTGKQMPVLEADSKEGDELSRLYDIVSYPAILARNDDGSPLQLWQGKILPQVSEVSFYDA